MNPRTPGPPRMNGPFGHSDEQRAGLPVRPKVDHVFRREPNGWTKPGPWGSWAALWAPSAAALALIAILALAIAL